MDAGRLFHVDRLPWPLRLQGELQVPRPHRQDVDEGALPEQPPSVRIGQAVEAGLAKDDARGEAVGVAFELLVPLSK